MGIKYELFKWYQSPMTGKYDWYLVYSGNSRWQLFKHRVALRNHPCIKLIIR